MVGQMFSKVFFQKACDKQKFIQKCISFLSAYTLAFLILIMLFFTLTVLIWLGFQILYNIILFLFQGISLQLYISSSFILGQFALSGIT